MASRFELTSRVSSVRAGIAFLLPALLLIGLLYVLPLAKLAVISFGERDLSLEPYRALFGLWSYSEILVRTFCVSTLVVVGCFLFGYPIGYVLAFSTRRRRVLLALLVLLPFWTSVLVRNFAWIFLLRDGGLISTAAGVLVGAGEPLHLLYDEMGVVVGMISTLLPFMVFPVFLSIVLQDGSLREAAGSLGASPARVFLSVTLPLSRNGIFAGSFLVFATAIGFFITPALLGGGRVLMTATFIGQQIDVFLNWPLAAAAAMVLLFTVIALVVGYLHFTRADSFGMRYDD